MTYFKNLQLPNIIFIGVFHKTKDLKKIYKVRYMCT